MSGSVDRARVVAMLAVFLLLAAVSAPAAGDTLEGRWKLVEQNYGKGRMNLADLEAPVLLEFLGGVQGVRATIRTAGNESRALPWPAYVNDEGPVPVEVLEVSADPAARKAGARYRVRPSPEDDLVLLIVEEYSLSEDGETLRGSATVTFTVGEEKRGSFVLHRRFERVR